MTIGYEKYQDGYIVYKRSDIIGFVKKVRDILWLGYVHSTNRTVSGKTRKEAAMKMVEQ